MLVILVAPVAWVGGGWWAGVAVGPSPNPVSTPGSTDMNTQPAQIGIMTGLFNARAHTQTGSQVQMTWMVGQTSMGSTPGRVTSETRRTGITGLMPGMATSAPIAELCVARGEDIGLLFLTVMLTHQLGGIAMAQDDSEHAATGPVRTLAKKMVIAQSAESVAMRHLIAARS